jgi:hypothetical protein
MSDALRSSADCSCSHRADRVTGLKFYGNSNVARVTLRYCENLGVLPRLHRKVLFRPVPGRACVPRSLFLRPNNPHFSCEVLS